MSIVSDYPDAANCKICHEVRGYESCQRCGQLVCKLCSEERPPDVLGSIICEACLSWDLPIGSRSREIIWEYDLANTIKNQWR